MGYTSGKEYGSEESMMYGKEYVWVDYLDGKSLSRRSKLFRHTGKGFLADIEFQENNTPHTHSALLILTFWSHVVLHHRCHLSGEDGAHIFWCKHVAMQGAKGW
jgi:hypothetical protein